MGDIPNNNININSSAIADVVGNTIIECYGIVGLCSKFNPNGNVRLLVNKDLLTRGIEFFNDKKEGYILNINIVVTYGTKITEVISELRKRVKYVIKKTFGIELNKINIFVEGIKEIN